MAEASVPKATGRQKRSAMWIHFTKKDGKGICKYCDCEISMKNGNLSNLTRHIKNKHPTVEISSSLMFTRRDAPSMILKVEEDPLAKSESEVAAAGRLKWTSKSEQREHKRLKNANNRVVVIQDGREPQDDNQGREEYYEELVYPEERHRGQTRLYEENMDDAESFPPMMMETVEMVADPPAKLDEKPFDDGDSDRHFLLSLLPLMRKLRPEDNIDIRIQIQNTFKEKLFPPKDPFTSDSNTMQ